MVWPRSGSQQAGRIVMRPFLFTFCAVVSCGAALAVPVESYRIFDGSLPDNTPQVFAPKIFLRDKSFIGYQTFDATGREFYYAVTDRDWTSSALYMRKAEAPFKAVKLGLLHSRWEGEPFITADGRKMYFTAILPPGSKPWHSDLYVTERRGAGWGTPHPLPPPINTASSEWHVSLTKKGVLYFCSEREGGRLKGDIFRAVPQNGTYAVQKLPDTVNSAFNDCDPLIAPDESWLVFHSNRPGGEGEHDLYISFRDAAGHWSKAVNMGNKLNTPAWEMAPSLTPDGRYLMFARRKAFATNEPSQIWWVSTRIVEQFRPQ